ncbi:four-carbon acid sugar kinase family protein [Xenophilus arseniciresistens]|uniref:Four-carbon acid sugar kinase family protein n=1 Tax=Xenophilus arseniciresistens TaxID=1283306 RepID=A0AAE3SYL1_9BURK|nr:four-carbon acid sugar kinase family protein [Xenophilus arseniciresistens]MDA7415610.1 four-carbon acid sugar kinase family protein [Xenophilus arseniciresistens]
MPDAPAILYYGDDFTGATDTLGTAARAGLRALLFLRLPDAAQLQAAGALDCVGVAGAARAMSLAEMQAELQPIAQLFARLGARVLHYKLCSTFDSAPEVGSIGVALQTLRAGLPAGTRTALVGGQPDLGRYCLFGNLYARAGSTGEVFRIDRHPTMSRHPVTPMHEADLRRHLGAQGLHDLRLAPWLLHTGEGAALTQAWDAAAHADGLLFDVRDNEDLQRIGALLWRAAQQAPVLAAGASSVVQALAPQLVQHTPTAQALAPATSPVFAMAGSLSPVTAAQVAAAQSFEQVWVDPQALCTDAAFLQTQAADMAARLQAGRHVLACTVRPGQSPAADTGVSGRELALAGGRLLRAVLQQAPDVRRVGVAGGDTSSHAVQALDAWGLSYRAVVSTGVSLCRLHSDDAQLDGLEIALKGGQMGAPDLFERLLHGS